ncbi:hypothetical protein E2C01_039134 [Portunus trituberculatus]|uniref:Uncharacterized protein n=1 Tax=Portunus trituberculatus TaxID=210409 RepID=A0A5B7FIU4_PORTR|nr:hypothetical protein [Portunus trituberculatus]
MAGLHSASRPPLSANQRGGTWTVTGLSYVKEEKEVEDEEEQEEEDEEKQKMKMKKKKKRKRH